MKMQKPISGCAHCGINRRQFLAAGCAACTGVAGLVTKTEKTCNAQTEGKIRIRIIYSLHAPKQPGPDWPNVGFDFRPVMKRTDADLSEQCEGFDFISSIANGPDQAKKILEQDKSAAIDGYIVYQMNCWNQVVQTIATSGKPVLYVDFKYGGSGGFLVYSARFLRNKAQNVGYVASTQIEDVVEAVKCFKLVKKGRSVSDFVAATERLRIERTHKAGNLVCIEDNFKTISPKECLRQMKDSKILSVRSQETGDAEPMMGIPVEKVSFAEVNEAWKDADKNKAGEIVERWEKTALQITDVKRATLQSSAEMYLGMKNVLKKHGANAIAINCLGGFYGGHIHAYPCLGFHELNNEGLIGACECDLMSTSTMVAMTALTQGRPGYISDPVIDTSKRQIIYAHCVASNKVFGPKGRTNPYQIMTHSEDRQGACVRSILPLGYMTTTLKFSHDRKEIIFHQGKAVENDPDDRACRTKLAVEPVGDIEKLFTMWDHWGWHRVTYYGDLKEPVFALADALGFKIIQET
ncbi:MAG: hypothetical protein JW837_11675 [Sedimentisphaerales bacterium]|nr:hypothetical protein [Sedimentisphaerales bacterium]